MTSSSSSSSSSSSEVVYFSDKYVVGSLLGSGSFGEIFSVRSRKTDESLAAKVEVKNSKEKSQLRREAKIYMKLVGLDGIPRCRWFGDLEDKYVLIMDLLGNSLEFFFNYCDRRFTLKTVVVLGYEIIKRIQTIHNKGFIIHRDIKPENFLMGRGKDRHKVFMIDFGLAKQYMNPYTGKHITCSSGHYLTGTARYASINAHKGLDQSRRDDLISVGYVLLYFLVGSLPWQGFQTKANSNAERYKLIMDMKMNTSIDTLCYGLPDEFHQYFEHVYSLGFDDAPDYVHLLRLFRELFKNMQSEHSHAFLDWEELGFIEGI